MNLCNIAPVKYPGSCVIHDLGVIDAPSGFSWKQRFIYKLINAKNVKKYKNIFTVSNLMKNRIEEYEKKIKNNNPLPNKPGSEKQENNDNIDNDDFDIILSTLKMLKKAVTVSELQEASNELDRYSSQKIFALLAELVRKGKVKKTIIYKKSYYEIEQ